MDPSVSTRHPNASKIATTFEQLLHKRCSVKKLRKENSQLSTNRSQSRAKKQNAPAKPRQQITIKTRNSTAAVDSQLKLRRNSGNVVKVQTHRKKIELQKPQIQSKTCVMKEQAKVKTQVAALLKTPFHRVPLAAEKSLDTSSLGHENTSASKNCMQLY